MKCFNRRGFSLLEVLVAMGILAIVLPGFVAMFLGSKSAQVGSFASEQATQLAEAKLDSMRWVGRTLLKPAGLWSNSQTTTVNGKSAAWRWRFDTTLGIPRRSGILSVEVSWLQGKTAHAITLQGGVL